MCGKHEKIEKVTTSQDDDFLGVLKKNNPNKFALMGRSPGVGSERTNSPGGTVDITESFNRPCGTACKFAVLTQTLKARTYPPVPSALSFSAACSAVSRDTPTGEGLEGV